MTKSTLEIKKELEIKLGSFRLKRKQTIDLFKKKLEKAKIEEVRNSIN
jgi:hypothetical protein